MTAFSLDDHDVALPRGAFAKGTRRWLRLDGAPVLAVTQGAFRNYLYPLTTPSGLAVTAERPADHPHHNSAWIASDHVHALVPGPHEAPETYTYNLYVEETFQGRAPGAIRETAAAVAAGPGGAVDIDQELVWSGPPEWGAAGGRALLRERRRTRVARRGPAHVIDLRSTLSAIEWTVTLGPTRHGYFNLRLAEIIALRGGLLASDGATRPADICAGAARWVDLSGDAGAGRVAGACLMSPDPSWRWFVADWGVITLQPCLARAMTIAPGLPISMEARLVVHDGPPDHAMLEALHAELAAAGPDRGERS